MRDKENCPRNVGAGITPARALLPNCCRSHLLWERPGSRREEKAKENKHGSPADHDPRSIIWQFVRRSWAGLPANEAMSAALITFQCQENKPNCCLETTTLRLFFLFLFFFFFFWRVLHCPKRTLSFRKFGSFHHHHPPPPFPQESQLSQSRIIQATKI